MTIRLSFRFISFLILGLLAVGGIFLVLHATPQGLSLSDDSIGYIAGARSMLEGHGYREAWLASNGPVTHFPPGFSSALTFIGLFGLDPLRAARFLNAVLFGLNLTIMGFLGWRMTKSLPAGLALAVLFLVNDSLLRVHTAALSEPLFIFLSFLGFWMFDLYIERDAHWLWLVACGVFVGMAYLTRYAGLALLGTFLIALLIVHRSWGRRWASISIFAASALPWIAGWSIYNAFVGGTLTNRALVWHPISASNLEIALRTASTFLMPLESWRTVAFKLPILFTIMIVIILLAILVWIVIKARDFLAPAKDRSLPSAVAFANGLYIYCYLGAIFASVSLFDASTKFRLRILAPIYVSLLILILALAIWAWQRRRGVVVVLALIVFGLSVYGQVSTVNELARGGQGFASFKWYDSKAMAFLRGLPPGVMIYTNEPGAVYLYTGRGTYVLPDRYDPVTAEVRPGFERGVAEMQTEIKAGRAVLALFSSDQPSAADAVLLSKGLFLADKSAGAEIYTAQP